MMKLLRIFLLFTFSMIAVLTSGCYQMRKSKGGGQTDVPQQRKIETADIALPQGYKIEAVATNLNFPTGVAFDEQGNPYVTESGYSYGEVFATPKLLKINPDGKTSVVAEGSNNGPWNGVIFSKGNFYITEGGAIVGGKILRVSLDGSKKELIKDLPSVGDHHTNGPAIGPDGYIYFGQGTATNSAMVGKDNFEFGWLKRQKDFHDIPCKDITLSGQNFESENPLTEDAKDKVTTGAYSPFGTSTSPGQVIKGRVPCTGAVMRIPAEGGPAELVAWGLRNPYGLVFSPNGKLYVTDNAFDDRGSRPVWGTGDVLWSIENGVWYGWPDHSAGEPLTKPDFRPPGKEPLKMLLEKKPNEPPKAAAILGVHSSSNGIDFSRNNAFGYNGEAFIAQFGDMAPKVGKVLHAVGFKVIRVNVEVGVVEDFAVNKGKRNGPATYYGKGGLERPVAVRFTPDGNTLYIVDFGIMKMTKMGPQPLQNTGVLWKVTKQ